MSSWSGDQTAATPPLVVAPDHQISEHFRAPLTGQDIAQYL